MVTLAVIGALLLSGCQRSGASHGTSSDRKQTTLVSGPGGLGAPPPGGGPPPTDVYRNDRPGTLSPVVQGMPTRIYVPNSDEATVDEIDPSSGRVVRHFDTGQLPQHVVPSWDLKTLYVPNDMGNSLTPIDAVTGEPRVPIPVEDPYNLYFTPDGTSAMVVAERRARLDFRDPPLRSASGFMAPAVATALPPPPPRFGIDRPTLEPPKPCRASSAAPGWRSITTRPSPRHMRRLLASRCCLRLSSGCGSRVGDRCPGRLPAGIATGAR